MEEHLVVKILQWDVKENYGEVSCTVSSFFYV
jgi:hypothetical protein